MRTPADQERLYVDAVITTYTALPGTPIKGSRSDRQLAHALCRRAVPLRTVRTALFLATARRTLRSGPPLPAVRTLHSFLTAIHEVLQHPPEPDYLAYVVGMLKPFSSQKSALLGER
jgi:hypothetical protein